ncbi:MAG: hypothetical protein JWQ49_3729 [Edaphobacter sp.]|nr:hypothetical protein [Edaphobacter sp.]
MPDLKKAVALLDNEEHPTAADFENDFKHCKFTRLTLGALGPAVLVAWTPLRTPNASMLNIYPSTQRCGMCQHQTVSYQSDEKSQHPEHTWLVSEKMLRKLSRDSILSGHT